jgi:hypothetical protein
VAELIASSSPNNTHPMSSLKEQLLQWTEAYAAAKASNNPTLVQFAAANLSAFVESLELSQPGQEGQAEVTAEEE